MNDRSINATKYNDDMDPDPDWPVKEYHNGEAEL